VKKTELTELARQSTEAFVEAQKKLLDAANEQINANLTAARKATEARPRVPTLPLADLTRQGVESFVAAQKALLDVMTNPKPAAGAVPHPAEHAARPEPRSHRALAR